MSAVNVNEMDRLFSSAFGEQWIAAGMAHRTKQELASAVNLADDNATQALEQLQALGRALAHVDVRKDLASGDVNRLGFLVASVAEHAGMCLQIASTAREMQEPDLRRLHLASAA